MVIMCGIVMCVCVLEYARATLTTGMEMQDIKKLEASSDVVDNVTL